MCVCAWLGLRMHGVDAPLHALTSSTPHVQIGASENIHTPTVSLAALSSTSGPIATDTCIGTSPGQSFSCSYTIVEGGQDGNAAYSVAFSDAFGNPGVAVTAPTDGLAVDVDANTPVPIATMRSHKIRNLENMRD